jgi:hypothetical protein
MTSCAGWDGDEMVICQYLSVEKILLATRIAAVVKGEG